MKRNLAQELCSKTKNKQEFHSNWYNGALTRISFRRSHFENLKHILRYSNIFFFIHNVWNKSLFIAIFFNRNHFWFNHFICNEPINLKWLILCWKQWYKFLGTYQLVLDSFLKVSICNLLLFLTVYLERVYFLFSAWEVHSFIIIWYRISQKHSPHSKGNNTVFSCFKFKPAHEEIHLKQR